MKRHLHFFKPKPGTALVLFLLCFLFYSVFCIYAQEEPGDAEIAENTEITEDNSDSTEAENQTDADYIEMDIKTSTLMELAAWCRELGLSEGGTREELAARLRSHYKIPPAGASTEGQRIITIESAKTTEYFTLDVVDEEYARLKGDVILSLKDGDSVHRIKAWEILYNRTRNIITASGKVEYVKEEKDSVETFRGESITVNLDNWSSIFMDGVSERSKAGNTTAYRFAGTVISRNSEEVTVLTGADITNPKNEEAFWSLHASKLWLLPGNDWAILNAVLKVGNIPLLYLPFFYYPSDEIVFHPVLGLRSREGTFLQTTTYILGRPKTEAVTENSITKIFGGTSENMEKKREGVFLRSTGEKRVDPNTTRLSILFDAYVNLGIYLGTELALPAKGSLGAMTVSAGIGFTRNVYFFNNYYTPFNQLGGDSELSWGKLFSLDVPFRIRFDIKGSYQIKNGSLSWSFPYYSDPYVDRDFMNRTEVLDWLGMLRDGAGASDDLTASYTSLSSYEWRLNGSYSPQVPKLAPYISSLSISSFSTSLLFLNRDNPGIMWSSTPIPNPDYAFFTPRSFTLYSVSASVRGTPITAGSSAVKQPRAQVKDSVSGDSLLPDIPVSPWGNGGQASGAEASGSKQSTDWDSGENSAQDEYSLSPPVLSQRFSLPGSSSSTRFTFDYRLAPTAVMEEQFKLKDEVSWDPSTILSKVQTDGNLNFRVDHSAYSGSLGFSGNGVWQDYVLYEGDNEKAARLNTRQATRFTSSWTLSTSVRPFFQSAVWGKSSFTYSLAGLLARNTADATGERKWDFGEWDPTKITTSQVSANVTASIMDYDQNLTVSAVLPPKDSSVTASAYFRAWISTTRVSSGLNNPWNRDEWQFHPVSLSETLEFGSVGNFVQYVVYDPEKSDFTTLTSTLELGKIGLSASFSMGYDKPWRFNPSYNDPSAIDKSLWIQDNDFAFVPNDFRLDYSKTFTPRPFWKNRLVFSVNMSTSLTFDLQQYTSSRLDFSLGFRLGITNFLDVTFTTRSENKVIYKYFQGLPFFDSPPVDLYSNSETNFFVDLFNSFRFDSPDLRRKSGFKLKSLNLSFIHHLGDWNANLTVSMIPDLDRSSSPPSWYFKNEISFLVQWVPIGEIKSEINYTDDYTGKKLVVK